MKALSPEKVKEEGLTLVAPGVWRSKAGKPPQFAIAELVRDSQDKSLVRVAPNLKRWVRLTNSVLESIGLGGQKRTMIRLIQAGFIRGGSMAPKSYVMDVDSLIQHLEAVSDDPYWWDVADRRARYANAVAGVAFERVPDRAGNGGFK